MTLPILRSSTRAPDGVFQLEGRIAPSTIERRVIQSLPNTIERYAARVDQAWHQAIASFQALTIRDTYVYVASSFAYAQLPLGTRFEITFSIGHPQVAVARPADLLAVIAEWVPLPMPFVDAGHRTICLFDFPHGIPQIVHELPLVEQYMQGTSDQQVGLSNETTWRMLMQKRE